eukprot:CAMPEP_0171353860 /NCGR_PEP_ID=MMETSP0878-20121228/44406_1 /TAXON_ID=67004 /ORGANISM="Thalassiosira weissflogii, Strain CCMP1336" /LENGTH=972 /DNA_ID=CAMNT_0011859817 /DNA_START=68 /DNA_END=2986 /DNA_ORIENTATION=+
MKFFFASLTPATLSLWSNALHVAAEVSGTTARDIDLDHSGPKKRNRGNLRNHGIIKNDVSSQHARQIKVFHPYRLLRPEGALSWCRVNSCPPISAARPHCDTTTGMCVECLVDEHCHSLYGDKTLECVLDNVNSCRKKKHMAPIAMIRTESTIALSGTSSSSSVSSTVTFVSIQCLNDDECPSEKPICEDLSNGMCFDPPCGYCKSETEISVTNPTLQANKSTTSTSLTQTPKELFQSSTANSATIPTTNSGIELASPWPNGDELADYASCSFDCCTNDDCDSMTDSNDPGTSSSSSVSSSVTSVSIQCVDDDECPSEKPICEDLSNGICFNPPCGYCKSETEISVTNPTLQANKSTTSTSFIQSSTASPTTIPTADSDIELASLWPNGDELADYASCSFDCCTNNDCDSMTDSDDRIIGGCCLEGTCQLKNSPDEICWDVIGPPADIVCGYDAWMNYRNDGHCETKPVPTTTSTSHLSSTVSSSSIKSTPVIPTTNSGILWPNGDELADYASCSFDCCTNDDCDSMTDSDDRIIGGCCLEGTCQLKNSPDEICWDVIGPPADIVCGYDAWMNYRNDGHCETKPVPTTTSTSHLSSTVSSSSIKSTPVIPTTNSGILWPNGDELADYASCSFDCCTNDDCDSMTDSDDRIIGGCCLEGTCQLKNSPDEICWDVIGPPADIVCGYDAWMNYRNDGHCEAQQVPTIPTTSSDPIKAQIPKTTTAQFVTTTLESKTDFVNTSELNKTPDYSSCEFSCCTKNDCKNMVDHLNRIVGGCCVEGYCQAKSNPRDRCPSNVFADGAESQLSLCGYDAWVAFDNDGCVIDDSEADIICGYDAWMNYQNDGHCEAQHVPTIPTTLSDPIKEQIPKTITANFDTTTLESTSDFVNTSEISDYSRCKFSCCTKNDCKSMVDHLNRIVGGCCVEGYCQAKSNPRDRCPSNVFSDGADAQSSLCGYDAWVAFDNDGCVIDDSELV